MRPFSDYTEQFFWSYKRMDNVNYNFTVIEHLYTARKAGTSPSHFNKPIVLLQVAIIECALYDFLMRIRQRTRDPLPNLSQAIIGFLKGASRSDELSVLLPRFRSQNLLRVKAGDTLYDDLDYLRHCRNRLHIQNRYASPLHNDEDTVFTDRTLKKAEESFEKVIEVLCNVYPRWNKQPLPMADFPRPWL